MNMQAEDNTRKILIIDDEIDFCRMMKQNFESTWRVETLLAHDENEGLALAARHHPDLILLDMVMPRTDGLSTLKKLKKKEKTQGIPVIIISGKDPDSYLTDVIENYAEHIFAKPVRLTDLNRRIQDLFEISPGRR